MKLDNKVIWITGASSGIGEAIAKELDGYTNIKLILSARREKELQRVQNELNSESFVLPLDVTEVDKANSLAREAFDKFGRIDILINNSGISQRGKALDTNIEVDRTLMEIDYFGNIALAKAVGRHFRKQKSGKYVIMSSLSGKFGFHLRSAYCAAKHALHGFYETLRMEEEENGISVLLVCPGKIATDISKSALNSEGKAHGKMDANQRNGIPVEQCAKEVVEGIKNDKLEILIGGKEILAAKLKRLLPTKSFFNLIKKQSPT